MDSAEGRSNVELDGWLSIATRKLCSESQERIRKEIEEHYNESVDAARSQGYRDADAQRLAIETLGNPRSAARSFRRHHLTKFQAGLVKEVGRKPPKYRFYLYAPVFVLAFVWSGIAYYVYPPDPFAAENERSPAEISLNRHYSVSGVSTVFKHLNIG